MTNGHKCTENISIKVSPAFHALYENLTPEQKKKAKQAMIDAIERTIYDSRYRPGMFSGLHQDNNSEED